MRLAAVFGCASIVACGVARADEPDFGNEIAPRTTNLVAADTTNTDQLWLNGGLGLDLNGAGFKVGVWEANDGGSSWVRGTHQELTGRVTYGDLGTPPGSFANHATHVAGTIAGSGVQGTARGMARQAQIVSYSASNDVSELRNAPADMYVSNHSYSFTRGWNESPSTYSGFGDYYFWNGDRAVSNEDASFGKYTSSTRSLDSALYDRPKLLSVWAAGNERNDSLPGSQTHYVAYFSTPPTTGTRISGTTAEGNFLMPRNDPQFPAPGSDGNNGAGFDSLSWMQVAKNSLTVGAINDITREDRTRSTPVSTAFSSYGPVDDGRIKVDVVANGNGLYSSVGSGDASYGTYSGTSMAAPNAAGTAVLLVEHYRNLRNAIPNSATTKGLIIHTAFDAGNVGPDYSTGWGVVDGAAAATFLTQAQSPSSRSFLEERTYTGSAYPFQVTSDGSQPLKATICWTDPATSALASASGVDDTRLALVNDLDLWITGPDGVTTFFPWNLDPANPAASAYQSARNFRDNVEQVLIDMPFAGLYTIWIGHSGSTFTQNYSLFTSGGLVPEPGSLLVVVSVALLLRRRRDCDVSH